MQRLAKIKVAVKHELILDSRFPIPDSPEMDSRVWNRESIHIEFPLLSVTAVGFTPP